MRADFSFKRPHQQGGKAYGLSETALCQKRCHSCRQLDKLRQQGSDFLAIRRRHIEASEFLFQDRSLQRLASIGAGRASVGIVPGAVFAVAQFARGTGPGPQLDQRVNPQVEVKRSHVGEVSDDPFDRADPATIEPCPPLKPSLEQRIEISRFDRVFRQGLRITSTNAVTWNCEDRPNLPAKPASAEYRGGIGMR